MPPRPNGLRNVDLKGASLTLLICVFWGISPTTVKIALGDVTPIRLAAIRFLVGGVVILLWGWRTGRLAGFRIAPGEVRSLVVVVLSLGPASWIRCQR